MGSVNLEESLRCTSCGASLKFASRSGNGYRCLTCHAITVDPGAAWPTPAPSGAPDVAAAWGDLRYGANAAMPRGDQRVIVRAYRARSQQAAAPQMQADAERLAAAGYAPVAQSWAQGSWGAGAFILAIILILLFGLGLLLLLALLIWRPAGTLTVTYELREQATPPSAPAPPAPPTKVCPDCAETVLADARICRFCRHEFGAGAG